MNFSFEDLLANPFRGIRLKGDLKNYWKYVVSFQGIGYRIAYQIDEADKIVFIIAVGTRERFYERLIRRLK